MIELAVLVWGVMAFFAFLGWMRGYTKEIISLAGIMLGLFAVYQFDNVVRQTLLAGLPPDQRFYVMSVIFLVIVLFAYQTRALIGTEANRARGGDQRDALQTKVLGALLGGLNGYLVAGTIWYFLEINRLPTGQYPLDPYIIAPVVGTSSADIVRNLPLFILTQNGTNGDLLSFSVVVLFVVVLVII